MIYISSSRWWRIRVRRSFSRGERMGLTGLVLQYRYHVGQQHWISLCTCVQPASAQRCRTLRCPDGFHTYQPDVVTLNKDYCDVLLWIGSFLLILESCIYRTWRSGKEASSGRGTTLRCLSKEADLRLTIYVFLELFLAKLAHSKLQN